jgi:hypothetical protein
VDQSASQNVWVTLGKFPMSYGQVRLDDITGECGSEYQIAFNALEWIYQGPAA